MRQIPFSLLFFLLLIASNAEASEKLPKYQLNIPGPHLFSAGPEVYHITREKIGGSSQDGWMLGIHATYERLRHYGFYWAIDGYWAKGKIEGDTRSGKILKSTLTDYQLEGRLGYSLCFPICKKLRLVPYGGYGTFKSINDFEDPTPIPYTLENTFDYWLGGIMALIDFNNCWDLGVHFKYKYPLEPKNKVTDDPVLLDTTLNIGIEVQYEIEVPIRYYWCCRGKNTGITFTPFYRFRHYGQYDNFPNDFNDTRFHIAGMRCLVQVAF